MKACLRAGLIVLIGTLASGCAAGGFEAGASKQHLVAAGVSPAAAACVVNHMGTLFGDKRLGARAEPTAAERRAQRSLLTQCGVK